LDFLISGGPSDGVDGPREVDGDREVEGRKDEDKGAKKIISV
jgi:hypothetical protein